MMSRADFQTIAVALEGVLSKQLTKSERVIALMVTHQVADALRLCNPRFDRGRFLKACGVLESEMQ